MKKLIIFITLLFTTSVLSKSVQELLTGPSRQWVTCTLYNQSESLEKRALLNDKADTIELRFRKQVSLPAGEIVATGFYARIQDTTNFIRPQLLRVNDSLYYSPFMDSIYSALPKLSPEETALKQFYESEQRAGRTRLAIAGTLLIPLCITTIQNIAQNNEDENGESRSVTPRMSIGYTPGGGQIFGLVLPYALIVPATITGMRGLAQLYEIKKIKPEYDSLQQRVQLSIAINPLKRELALIGEF